VANGGKWQEEAVELKRILVGVDGSPAAAAALRWAADVVAKDGEILAVHGDGAALIGQAAVSAATGLGMFPGVRSDPAAQRRLLEEHYCGALRGSDVAHRMIVSDADPVHALLDVAHRENVDLIVIGHQGNSGFVHRLVQGLSDHLIDHARRPVVVVPYYAA
jgi:nucleotide-binding universal stress UspA family protein